MTRIDGKLIQDDWKQETPSGTVNGTNPTFTLADVPSDPKWVMVYINGIKQKYGSDYTVSGQTITMTTPPAVAQGIEASYLKEN
jgi:hypothetical protein